MYRNLLPLVIVFGVTATPSIAGGAKPIELKTTQIDLPESDRMFPEGPGSDAVNNNCLACHSAGMVLNQPELSKQAWAAEVDKMINTYKAPVAPEDVAPIVDYLASRKGVK